MERFTTHAENMKENGSVSLLLHSEDVFRKISDACRDGQTQFLTHIIDLRTQAISLQELHTSHSQASGNTTSSVASSELPVYNQPCTCGEVGGLQRGFGAESKKLITSRWNLKPCFRDSSKPQ